MSFKGKVVLSMLLFILYILLAFFTKTLNTTTF